MPPHSPPPSAPMALDLGAFVTLAVSRPPDFAPHLVIHTFRRLSTAKEPQSENSREGNGQGTKWPGSETARE